MFLSLFFSFTTSNHRHHLTNSFSWLAGHTPSGEALFGLAERFFMEREKRERGFIIIFLPWTETKMLKFAFYIVYAPWRSPMKPAFPYHLWNHYRHNMCRGPLTSQCFLIILSHVATEHCVRVLAFQCQVLLIYLIKRVSERGKEDANSNQRPLHMILNNVDQDKYYNFCSPCQIKSGHFT